MLAMDGRDMTKKKSRNDNVGIHKNDKRKRYTNPAL